MKSIRLNLSDTFAYPDDVETIVKAFAQDGYDCTPEQAHWLWQEYSDSVCAGWMTVRNDGFIVNHCRPYFTVVGMD
jgi:hypothetical protein